MCCDGFPNTDFTAILKQSTLYDGIRQFLFILPGIAAISATALAWIYQSINSKVIRIFVSILMITLFSPIVFDMVALHPYEYIYFNRIFGGLGSAYNRYETDYWGLSMREGMEWINNNASPNTTIVSSTHLHSSKTFAVSSLNVISYEEFNTIGVSRPFYYIARPRWQFQNEFPNCKVVYRVFRQEVPLTIVKKCD